MRSVKDSSARQIQQIRHARGEIIEKQALWQDSKNADPEGRLGEH